MARPHAPAGGRGRGDEPRVPAGRDGRRRAPLHRPPLILARPGAGEAVPRPRPPRVCGDVPAVPLPLGRQLRRARLRRREVRHEPAASREVAPGRALEGARAERSAGRLDRSLPVLHEGGLPGAAEAEGAGGRRLLEDSQRRARRRDAYGPPVRRGGRGKAHHAEPLGRRDRDDAGEAHGNVPAQGDNRGGERRRHRRVGSAEHLDDLGEDAPYARRLQPLRGAQGEGQGRRCDVARRGDRGRWRVRRRERTRAGREARQPDTADVSTPPMLRQLRHDVWATEKLLERCRALTDEELELTVPGTYGSIRITLVHIVAAAERYLRRFMTVPEPLLDEDADADATLDEIARHIPHLSEGVEMLFGGGAFDPDRMIRDERRDG